MTAGDLGEPMAQDPTRTRALPRKMPRLFNTSSSFGPTEDFTVCEYCQKLLLDMRKLPQLNPNQSFFFLQHRPSIHDWPLGTDAICAICLKLRLYFIDHGGAGPDGGIVFLDARSFHDETGASGIYVRSGVAHSTGGARFSATFFLKAVDVKHDRLGIAGYHPTDSASSEPSFALVRHWLQECTTKHTTCERSRLTSEEKQWSPTRLLKLDGKDKIVHLVEKAEIPPGVRYATLSHCWGKTPHAVKLQQHNLEVLKQDNLPDDLGKTLSEAVEVATRLGFTYLWIDSLCIIQDSAADWQQECALMSRVYKYSACNIAAAYAKDNSEGCFKERSWMKGLPLRVQYGSSGVNLWQQASDSPANGSEVPLTECAQVDEIFDFHSDESLSWHKEVEMAPLNLRGWVFQERLLTPRAIHYGDSRLYWECNELQASESEPWGSMNKATRDERLFKTRSPFAISQSQDNSSWLLKDKNGSREVKAWVSAIETYTTTDLTQDGQNEIENLTFPSDKLVAISAVARELKSYVRCQYLAGIWRSEIIRQLGWTAGHLGDKSPTYRAPSWSWASMQGRVGYPSKYWTSNSEHRYDLAEVLDAHVELAGADEFGQVSSGFLKLRGRLLGIHIGESQGVFTRGASKPVWYEDRRSYMLHAGDSYAGLHYPCHIPCLPLDLRFMRDGGAAFMALLLQKLPDDGSVDAGKFRRIGWLGSNNRRGLSVCRSDFEDDSILTALGSVEWDGERAAAFTPSSEGLTDITII